MSLKNAINGIWLEPPAVRELLGRQSSLDKSPIVLAVPTGVRRSETLLAAMQDRVGQQAPQGRAHHLLSGPTVEFHGRGDVESEIKDLVIRDWHSGFQPVRHS